MEDNKYILSCINGVPPSDAVCDYSSWLAKKLEKKLKIIHTLDHQFIESKPNLSGNIGLGSRDHLLEELVAIEHEQNKILLKKAKIILESAKIKAEQNGITEPKTCLRHGRLQENLLELKNEIEAIVIGRYGQKHQNLTKNAVGHKVEAVIRALEKPILVVSKAFVEPTSVLLAYDGSAASIKALNYLLVSQIFKNLTIHVVYVGEKSEKAAKFINDTVTRLEASNYIVKSQYLAGETDAALLNYLSQNNISLTAMGAFGHNWLRDLLVGSFTSKMLALSEQALFLVR